MNEISTKLNSDGTPVIKVPINVFVPDNGKDHTVMISIIEKTEPLPDQSTNIYRFSLEIPSKR